MLNEPTHHLVICGHPLLQALLQAQLHSPELATEAQDGVLHEVLSSRIERAGNRPGRSRSPRKLMVEKWMVGKLLVAPPGLLSIGEGLVEPPKTTPVSWAEEEPLLEGRGDGSKDEDDVASRPENTQSSTGRKRQAGDFVDVPMDPGIFVDVPMDPEGQKKHRS